MRKKLACKEEMPTELLKSDVLREKKTKSIVGTVHGHRWKFAVIMGHSCLVATDQIRSAIIKEHERWEVRKVVPPPEEEPEAKWNSFIRNYASEEFPPSNLEHYESSFVSDFVHTKPPQVGEEFDQSEYDIWDSVEETNPTITTVVQGDVEDEPILDDEESLHSSDFENDEKSLTSSDFEKESLPDSTESEATSTNDTELDIFVPH